MDNRNCLILTQYREGVQYNDFIGKFYHFPASDKKNYLKQFESLPIEFVYYEPDKKGKGEFYGYGKITKPPFPDKRERGHYFVEILDYKPFSKPVHFKNNNGEILETIFNTENYNYNNAVRKIKPDFLDSLCLDGNIQLNFKADSHLIKVLGEQLIGSEKVGILELVKNAIDAGASYCRVRIEKIEGLQPPVDEYEFPEYEGPVIVIEDDGSGMNREIIEKGWLRPASTLKTNVKERLKQERRKAEKSGKLASYNALIEQLKKAHKGRIPLGEKGVGRFATHRLGRNLVIKSKPKESDFEYILNVNWDKFDKYGDQEVDLDSIGVILTRQSPSRDYGKTDSGTQIIIYGGREGFGWDTKKIEDINQSIARLNSPNPNPNKISDSFKAYIECPQIPDLKTEQIYEKFTPNFSLQALVNEEGIVDEYTLSFTPPKSIPLSKEQWTDNHYDLKLAESEYWRNNDGGIRKPACGSFYVHIDAWYRRSPWIDGPDADLMKKYLHDYGGISIYRDNTIIFPAESGTKNDWLNLSLRHEKQVHRISYYNMIGNIEIDQSENIDLIDKTNREGMIENRAFKDLSKLVETIIQNILEIRYINKRDEYTDLTKGLIRDPKILSSLTKQNSIIISGIKDNYPLKEDPWKILHQLGETVEERKGGLVNLDSSIKNIRKSIDIIEDMNERMAEHAGFGIAAAVSIHEITKITTNFYNGISQLIKSGQSDKVKLEDLKSASASLKSELKRLAPLRAIRNENRRKFNVCQSIQYAFEVFKTKLEKENIQFTFNKDGNFPVYARYSTLNQVFGNLFDNSIYWILASGKKKREIKVDVNPKYRTVVFADSGTGLDNAIKPYLFQAGYSMKIPPSGLGLYICKSYMHAMDGDIHETSSRERIKGMDGAQFTLEFEKVPKSKEEIK